MLLPFPEWRPDVSDFRGASSLVIQNVLPRGDGYGPFPDFNALAQPLPAACRGYMFARNADGSITTFAGTATRLYKLNNTTLAWTDVSAGGAAYAALSASFHWQFVQFNNFVIAVQQNAPPQAFDLTSSAAFANLGGSPPQASYVAVISRFVVLSGLLSFPYRVQWSGLNAITTWDNLTAQSNYQDLADGGLNAYGALQNTLAPYLTPAALNPLSTPGLGTALSTVNSDITNQVNDQFAAAGRDLSPGNTAALARGLAQGEGGLIASQYNTNAGNQLGAANTLYNAGNTTAGTLSGLNQAGLTNMLQGASLAAQIPGLAARPGQAALTAADAAQRLPLQNLAGVESLLTPLAQLGSETSGTSQGTTTQSVPLAQQIVGGSIGTLGLLGQLGMPAGSLGLLGGIANLGNDWG